MKMTSRDRVRKALNHQETDRVPIDIGATACTGINASMLIDLRKALGLEDRLVKVVDPMMWLGLVEDDVRQALGADIAGLYMRGTLMGYKNIDFKPWVQPDGRTILIGGGFQAKKGEDGKIYAYPKGDTSKAPSAFMSPSGLYFDNIERQQDLSKHDFNAREDYKDQYSIIDDDELLYLEKTSKELYENTNYSIFGNYWNGGLGDFLHVPAAWLDKPKGIRNLTDWMMALYDHPDYVKEFFEMQTEITMENMKLYYQAVGNRIDTFVHTGTDFAHQCGLMLSKEQYREFYKPYHKKVNDWIHKNTQWKIFVHSCGAIAELLDDFIDAGFECINPVQISATGMDAKTLKEKYRDKLIFWGGSVDPQQILPYATPEEVSEETMKNIKIFAKGGGYIAANIHNIQYGVPAENIISLFKTFRETKI